MIKNICVAGAGTMGSGIALAAAQHQYPTILFDTNEIVLNKARSAIEKNLDTLIEKNKLTAEDKKIILGKITFTNSINDCTTDLIIEAIIEKEDVKISLFEQLASINNDTCIFASNTS